MIRALPNGRVFYFREQQILVLVEIVYALSGRGLTKDAKLLGDTICSLGHEVSIKALPPQHPFFRELSSRWSRVKKRISAPRIIELINSLQRISRRLPRIKTRTADLVIHLENIHPSHINSRSPNWLIPNQEWFRSERIHYLADIETVLCKTRTAKDCFEHYHPDVRYLGFSTPAAMNRSEWLLAGEQPTQCLHVAGASLFKGTETVVEAWRRNPQWPTLNLVVNRVSAEEHLPANVAVKSNLSEDALQALWQEAAIVVIPSEVEGYGQVLAEAMLYGGVVITTDAPPMNELVAEDRGYLVPYSATARFRLGTRYKVSTEELERVINKALEESIELRERKAMNALTWARNNHEAFRKQLEGCLTPLQPNLPSSDQSAGQSQA